ncbi:MAG: ribonuclease R [Bacillota bacterium]
MRELRRDILEYMDQKDYQPLRAEDLAAAMDVAEGELPAFFRTLRDMELDGSVVLSRKKRYGLCRHMGLVSGRVEGKSGGYAFLIPDEKNRGDIFLPADGLRGALHNDRVLARVVQEQRFVNGKDEGEVVRILNRANGEIIGVFRRENGGGVVTPEDKRVFREVAVAKNRSGGADDGDVVVVRVTSWPEGNAPLKGTVKEVIGRRNQPGTDMETVIRKYQLREEFPEKVLRAAALCAEPAEEDLKGRVDLRERLLMTIDGADARDLDDAVSLEIAANGHFLLGVHIADVSHYVAAGSALDKEAYRRGTSVYFPDRVLPMLPPALSNGICSLHPGVDRLTLSCEMEIDEKGRVLRHRLFESVIRSAFRMTYDDVNAVLRGDKERSERFADIRGLLFGFDRLREALNKRRERRGALTFHFAEAKAVLDENGETVDIVRRRQDRAEGIIEECMIAANETVAAHCFYRDIPLIYRVHDRPEDEKTLELAALIAPFGYTLSRRSDDVRPAHFQKLLAKIEGRPEQGLLEMMTLRTMSHAVYTTENRGHFGLASKCYCHFTSPIRRYPDLCVHRVVKAALAMERGSFDDDGGRLARRLGDAAVQSSGAERTAEDAEREALEAKMALYMASRIDEEFDGVISGVASYGFFVELENTVNGLVHVSDLEMDEYEYHHHTKTLLAKKSRVCYRLGDAVRVAVSRVNVDERLIDFTFLGFRDQTAKEE